MQERRALLDPERYTDVEEAVDTMDEGENTEAEVGGEAAEGC